MNLSTTITTAGFLLCGVLASYADVHMANGIKVGEVDSDSAIVWTRLTAHPERNTNGEPFDFAGKNAAQQPVYEDLSIMDGSVAGQSGSVRVTYWAKNLKNSKRSTKWKPVHQKSSRRFSKWQPVYPKNDYTHQFQLKGLKPNTSYELSVEGRDGNSNCILDGQFRTAPTASQAKDIRFVVTTCGDYPRRDDPKNGHKIYPQMLALDPDFFVHTGDIEYFDRPAPYATNLELARFKWNRIFSMPFIRNFHNNVSSYFMKDDHDTLKDDAWPGQNYFDLTWEQGLATFREQMPMGEKTYRTIRWGNDLQIWLVEGRDFRSPNNMPDGPEKTIWGAEQKQWFFDTVQASDATFKVLLSPTPVVGPDRLKGKNDNHSNAAFATEGNEIRAFIAAQPNMTVVCGDRHWQYASIDPKTGLREFSCGPASDKHAAGYSEEFYGEMHRFLRVKGGFLSVDVDSKAESITFKHHRVDGTVRYEESFTN
jgi:alkaline phosphatase D